MKVNETILADRIVRRLQRTLFGSDKISYAQCGEDLIVSCLFGILGISNPTYLDLGAHHPTYLSNTYYFYLRRSYGVCVEPDPISFRNFQRKRRRDVCLNVGVGREMSAGMDLFLMSASTLNTFSEEEAKQLEATTSYSIVRKIRVPVVTVNQIIEQRFKTCPNFISLDIEGMDLEILKAFDFERWRPQVFCVETLVFSERKSGAVKIQDIIDFMEGQDYFAYADTFINTIFVDKAYWRDEPARIAL